MRAGRWAAATGPAQVHPAGGRCKGRFARSIMAFDVGDKVVYPHHGAATIEKRE
jgi:hypothetical protein